MLLWLQLRNLSMGTEYQMTGTQAQINQRITEISEEEFSGCPNKDSQGRCICHIIIRVEEIKDEAQG